MAWLRLTNSAGPLLVNSDHITELAPRPGGVRLNMVGNYSIDANEHFEWCSDYLGALIGAIRSPREHVQGARDVPEAPDGGSA